MRDYILSEIKRLADANGGRAPGKQAFQTATGIREADWNCGDGPFSSELNALSERQEAGAFQPVEVRPE